jgi:ubiquinone/menaquinone biosynthesis C-methylase UbiE
VVQTEQDAGSLKDSFDKVAGSYDNETCSLAHQVSEFVTMQNLLPILRGRHVTTVLDAGGGTGKWTIALAKLGLNVTLMDISPKSLAVAREKALRSGLEVKIAEANAERTSLPSSSFDFVLSQGPMSYTPDPQAMLMEMHRLLKPGGFIWLDFYNTVGWALENGDLSFKVNAVLCEEKLIKMPDWDYPARIFSISRVTELCHKAKFRVDAVYGNHTLMTTLPLSHIYSTDFEEKELAILKEAELKLSRQPGSVGASKACQIVATMPA